MSYAATSGNPYLTPSYYSPPSHLSSLDHVHSIAPSPRQEAAMRKRPKYTRSKTGCLTCRVKKIKCDEAKPNCARCTHGQRDCTWPEGVPARKKAPKKEPTERPGTAGSSGISEGSTPPTRDPTPPKRVVLDAGLPPLVSRRQNDPYLQLHAMSNETDLSRRQPGFNDRISQHGYPSLHQTSSPNLMHMMIPDLPTYPSHHRYDQTYASSRATPTHQISNLRPMSQPQQMHQWTQPFMAPVDHMDPYFHGLQDRNLVGHASHNDQHLRYQ